MNCCNDYGDCRQGRDCPARKAYTGPAKPIPTHTDLITDKGERVIFLLLAIVAAVFLYLE
jgi:1,4-dihydroxy-2-naphthoate octaprenyltransferase